MSLIAGGCLSGATPRGQPRTAGLDAAARVLRAARAADDGVVDVPQALHGSPSAPPIHAQRVVRFDHYRARNCLPPQKLRVGRDRARCLTARFPIPPVRTVRAAFTAHGSREAGITACFPFIDSMESTMVSVCLRQLPWYSCLPAPLGAFAMYVAFLRSDYYAPSDCLEGLGNF